MKKKISIMIVLCLIYAPFVYLFLYDTKNILNYLPALIIIMLIVTIIATAFAFTNLHKFWINLNNYLTRDRKDDKDADD